MNSSSTVNNSDKQAKPLPLWRRVFSYIVKYVIPLCVSVGLVVWLFHKVNVHEVMAEIHKGCDFWWIALMMIITMFSHMIRGIRWGIQLRAAGVARMPVVAESVSIFGAYALNLVFPRLGEVWRCVWVAKRQKASISTVVGTDFGDRGSDAVVVVALAVLCLIVARPAIDSFVTHYAVGKDIASFTDNPWLWCLIAIGVTVFWLVCRFGRKDKYIGELDMDLSRIWQGFKVLFHMKGIGWYVVLTFGIWICYFLETYVCFFAFPFTRRLIEEPGMALGLIPGLVVFVFGSFSMAIPSNGGLGPWNLAVMFALSLYGVTDAQGTAFSMIMWGSQAAMLVLLGIFSAIYVMADKGKRKVPASSSTTQKE